MESKLTHIEYNLIISIGIYFNFDVGFESGLESIVLGIVDVRFVLHAKIIYMRFKF